MNIFLIRHGQSYGNIIGNKTKTIRGITDNTSLTPKGKKQIEKIAKNFSHQKINLKKIFSSPLKRAYQSALIFKKYYPKTQIIIDENLKEINFGEFERKKWEFIKDHYQDWLNKYLKNKFNTPYPKGESRKDLINRINFFIKKNLTDNDKNYLIITHEEVIRSFLSIFFNNQEYFFSRENLLKIENGKVNSVFFDKKLNHIYQINSDIPSVLNSNLFYLIDNFLNENKIKKFFLNKNQTFSDNLVFTIFYKKNKLKILKI
ncbi:MAG: phosphoglycerate mutase family protein, partial [Patescibacteria group bacterium]|nr:phosphoglycerate mutase family protein [Patescibacteria group bacterium]